MFGGRTDHGPIFEQVIAHRVQRGHRICVYWSQVAGVIDFSDEFVLQPFLFSPAHTAS